MKRTLPLLLALLLPIAALTAAEPKLEITPVHRETPAEWHAVTSLTQSYPPVEFVADSSGEKTLAVLKRTPEGAAVLAVPAFTGRAQTVALTIRCPVPVAAAPTRIKLRWRFPHPERLPDLNRACIPGFSVGRISYQYDAGQRLYFVYPGWIPPVVDNKRAMWRIGSWMTKFKFDASQPQTLEASFDPKHFGGVTLNGEARVWDESADDKPWSTDRDFSIPMSDGGRGIGLSWSISVPAGEAADLIQIDEFTVEQQSPQRAVADVAINLPEARRVSVVVEDSRRVGVRHLLTDQPLPKGQTKFSWDGRDNDGRDVFDGGYTFRMATHDVRWEFAGVAGNTTPWDDIFRGQWYGCEAPVSLGVFPAASKSTPGAVLIGLSNHEQCQNLLVAPDGQCLNNKMSTPGCQWSPGIAVGERFQAVISPWAGVTVFDHADPNRPVKMSEWGGEGLLRTKNPMFDVPSVGLSKDVFVFGYKGDGKSTTTGLRGLAMIPGAEVLLVANMPDREIAWYDLKQNGKRLGGVTLEEPRGLCVTPADGDGNRTVYITAKDGVVSFRLNSDWTAEAPTTLIPATDFAYACRVAYDPARKWIYVSDPFDPLRKTVHNQVRVYTAAGKPVTVFGQPGGVKDPQAGGALADDILAGPTGLAVDNDGALWLCDTWSHRVIKYRVDDQGRFTKERLLISSGWNYWVPGEPETVIYSKKSGGDLLRMRMAKDADGRYRIQDVDALYQLRGTPPVRSRNAYGDKPAFQRVDGRLYLAWPGREINIYRLDGTHLQPVATIGPNLDDEVLKNIPRPDGDPKTWMHKPFIWTDRNADGKVDAGEIEVATGEPGSWWEMQYVTMLPDGSLIVTANTMSHGRKEEAAVFKPTFLPNGVPCYEWTKKTAALSQWGNGQQPLRMRFEPVGPDRWVANRRWGYRHEPWGMNDVSLFDVQGNRLWSRCREKYCTMGVEGLGDRFVMTWSSPWSSQADGYQVGLLDLDGNTLCNIGMSRHAGYGYSKEHIQGDMWLGDVRLLSDDEALVMNDETGGWKSNIYRVKGLTTAKAAKPVTVLLNGFATEWIQHFGDSAWVDTEGYFFGDNCKKDPFKRTATSPSGDYRYAVGPARVTWHLGVRPAGKYRLSVLLPYEKNDQADPQAAYTISHAGKTDTVVIDQRQGSFRVEGGTVDAATGLPLPGDQPKTVWIELGVFDLDGKGEESVGVGWNKHGTVVVDGLKLEKKVEQQ